MTLVRKKLSKSGWILLALFAVTIIVLPILHFTGVFKLDFLGSWAVAAANVAASSGWMAAIIAVSCGAVGFGACYILKDYVIGMEGANLQVTNTGSNYTALGTTPAPSNNSGTAVNP